MSPTELAAPANAATARSLLSDVLVAPSILAADFSRLGEQVREVLSAGARVIHCDVMDGHFVPPISFGPLVVSALGDLVHGAGAILDVHLMIERPERQVADFARAGADTITIHQEATPHAHYALAAIRDRGCLAGLALNPASPPELASPVGDAVDLCLCMTVDPGWGGQAFIASMPEKIVRLRTLLPERCALEVDGGVDPGTAPECVRRGANLLVAGSAIFAAPEPALAYNHLVAAAGAR